ncbi:hypothetical protein ACIG53_16545 [Streptomyces bauhiniae]|uniref:hypothetical protein n=1 Tax=Streptomyces bauhiniae TaxID=2340725 RepID=UPI0037CED8FE
MPLDLPGGPGRHPAAFRRVGDLVQAVQQDHTAATVEAAGEPAGRDLAVQPARRDGHRLQRRGLVGQQGGGVVAEVEQDRQWSLPWAPPASAQLQRRAAGQQPWAVPVPLALLLNSE